MVFDKKLRDKYAGILENIGKKNDGHGAFDNEKLKKLARAQEKNVKNDPNLVEQKRNFIKALFSSSD